MNKNYNDQLASIGLLPPSKKAQPQQFDFNFEQNDRYVDNDDIGAQDEVWGYKVQPAADQPKQDMQMYSSQQAQQVQNARQKQDTNCKNYKFGRQTQAFDHQKQNRSDTVYERRSPAKARPMSREDELNKLQYLDPVGIKFSTDKTGVKTRNTAAQMPQAQRQNEVQRYQQNIQQQSIQQDTNKTNMRDLELQKLQNQLYNAQIGDVHKNKAQFQQTQMQDQKFAFLPKDERRDQLNVLQNQNMGIEFASNQPKSGNYDKQNYIPNQQNVQQTKSISQPEATQNQVYQPIQQSQAQQYVKKPSQMTDQEYEAYEKQITVDGWKRLIRNILTNPKASTFEITEFNDLKQNSREFIAIYEDEKRQYPNQVIANAENNIAQKIKSPNKKEEVQQQKQQQAFNDYMTAKPISKLEKVRQQQQLAVKQNAQDAALVQVQQLKQEERQGKIEKQPEQFHSPQKLQLNTAAYQSPLNQAADQPIPQYNRSVTQQQYSPQYNPQYDQANAGEFQAIQSEIRSLQQRLDSAMQFHQQSMEKEQQLQNDIQVEKDLRSEAEYSLQQYQQDYQTIQEELMSIHNTIKQQEQKQEQNQLQAQQQNSQVQVNQQQQISANYGQNPQNYQQNSQQSKSNFTNSQNQQQQQLAQQQQTAIQQQPAQQQAVRNQNLQNMPKPQAQSQQQVPYQPQQPNGKMSIDDIIAQSKAEYKPQYKPAQQVQRKEAPRYPTNVANDVNMSQKDQNELDTDNPDIESSIVRMTTSKPAVNDGRSQKISPQMKNSEFNFNDKVIQLPKSRYNANVEDIIKKYAKK